MPDVQNRLQEAVEEWGAISDFSSRLKAAGVRGHTRNRVYSYLNGDTAPSIEWVRTAASILGVRPEWLAFGSEPKRPSGAEGKEKPWRKELEARSRWFRRLPFGAQYSFLDLVGFYQLSHPDFRTGPKGDPPPSSDETAERLAFILRLPLFAWGYNQPQHEHVPLEYWTQLMGGLRAGVDALTRGPASHEISREDPSVRAFMDTYYDESHLSPLGSAPSREETAIISGVTERDGRREDNETEKS